MLLRKKTAKDETCKHMPKTDGIKTVNYYIPRSDMTGLLAKILKMN